MRSFSIIGIAVAGLLVGCTGMRPGCETPTVTVKAVRALPSAWMLPEFEIDLHVVNPNREALKLAGVSYTVSLEGHELIQGVGNDLPVVKVMAKANSRSLPRLAHTQGNFDRVDPVPDQDSFHAFALLIFLATRIRNTGNRVAAHAKDNG